MSTSRRTFLQFAAGGIATTAIVGTMGSVGAQDFARPPGALVEEEFIARCSRCLRCIDVCQPAAIRPAGWLDGPRNLGTPILTVDKCIKCMECIRTCPSGALAKIPKNEVILGRITIVKEICTAWNGSRRCDRCFRTCQRAMRRNVAITMEDRTHPVIDYDKCDSCGQCIRTCPEPGALILDTSSVERQPAPEGRIITALDDRVGPYEIPPAPYQTWLTNRISYVARTFGLIK